MRNAYAAVALAAALLSTQAAAEGGSPWMVMPCWGGGYVQGATFCPSDPNRMYLYVDVGGPYRSDDAGASWRPLHADMPVDMRERGFDQVRSLSVDPRDADSFVILGGADGDTPGGFAVTRDGGRTWSLKYDAFAYGNSPRRADGLCLSRNPFNPDELVGGEDRSGIFVSRDNGETWALTSLAWFSASGRAASTLASGAALTPASRGFRFRGPGCRRLSRTRAPRRVSSRTRATARCC